MDYIVMLIILSVFFSTHFLCHRVDNFCNFMCRQDNVVQSVNREEQGSNDWSSKGNNSNLEGDSRVGFNVLDAMLKHSLDRLKCMRFVRILVGKVYIFLV